MPAGSGGTRRPGRPADLFHSDYLADDRDAPATPPYRMNMPSTLTLPPEYLAGDTAESSEVAGPSNAEKDSRAFESDADDQATERNAPNTPIRNHHGDSDEDDNTPPSSSSNPYQGDTLVGKQKGGPQTVHYPDEHGGLLHAMPSPGYPEPKTFEDSRPDPKRMFSNNSAYPPSVATTDDEGDEDDEFYDWSDEEDLVDEEAKFENKMGTTNKKKKTWGPKRIATFFLSTLIGSTILSGLIAAVPIIMHFYYLKPHRTPHREYVTDNVSAWLFWLAANILISWYLAMIINIIPAIVTWFVDLSWGNISEAFKGKVELYDAFKGWVKPVFYAACAWISWIILFDHIYKLHDSATEVASKATYTDRTVQAIEFLFFFVLVVCLEKIALQIIAFTFHQTAFQDRIDEVANAIKVIDQLKDYRPKRRGHGPTRSQAFNNGRKTPPILSSLRFDTPPGGKSEAVDYMSHHRTTSTPDPMALEEGMAGDTEDNSSSVKKKGKQRKSWLAGYKRADAVTESHRMESPPSKSRVRSRSPSDDMHGGRSTPGVHTYPPTSPDRRSVESHHSADDVINQAARALKSVVLHDARNIKGKEAGADGLAFSITSPHEAKKLARDLYFAFRADRKRTHLIPSDFYPAYPKPEEAKEAFKVFDRDGNENITRAEIKTAVLKVYKERRFLSRSMRDVGAAVKTLDLILLVAALLVLFFISLSIFNVNITKSLTSFYSLGIAASFIFKNSASNAFDAIIFLFVTHPYDTGDRCFIDAENLIVKKMGLFATTFTRSDGTQTYYFNSQLFGKFITNVRRSGKMFENLTMQVHWRTPLDKLDELEGLVNKWIEKDDNRWFDGGTSVTLQKIEFQRSLELTMGIPHNSTWQDWGAHNTRKTAFHAAVNHYSRQLGITWSASSQPVLFTEQQTLPPPPEGPDEDDDYVFDSGASRTGATAPPKPALGFLPPPEELESELRARKTKKKIRRGNFDA